MHFQKLYTTSGRDKEKIVDALLRHITGKVKEEDNKHLDRPSKEWKF
jgi:hypothetical protein